MNELSCSTVIALPWARAGWAIDGAIAAAAAPTTAVFRKSRRDPLVMAYSLVFARQGRPECLCCAIVLLLPPGRKALARKPLDVAATSRRIGPLDRNSGPDRPDIGGRPMRARLLLTAVVPLLAVAMAAQAAERHFSFGY